MNSLELTSSNAGTDKHNELDYRFRNPMKLDGWVSLSNITLWNNWKNISEKLGNNTFYFADISDIIKISGVLKVLEETILNSRSDLKAQQDIIAYIGANIDGQNNPPAYGGLLNFI